MNGDRPWYREPETFIAVAALVVSVSPVAVGLYEAKLQRAHDRAEVWPHVEISDVCDAERRVAIRREYRARPCDHQIGGRYRGRQTAAQLGRCTARSRRLRARGDEHDDRGRSCPPRRRTNGARGARSTGPAAPLLGVGRARGGHRLLFVRLQRELGCERRPSGRYEYVAVGGSVPEPGERRGFLSERRRGASPLSLFESPSGSL